MLLTVLSIVLGGGNRRAVRLPDAVWLYSNAGAQTNRYATVETPELATVKVRYKKPGKEDSTLKQWNLAPKVKPLQETQEDLQFATAVAGFGLLLRSEPLSEFDYEDVAALAQLARGKDLSGDRAEFLRLVKTAGALASAQAAPASAQPE